MDQRNLLDYWVVRTYDPRRKTFVDAFKSYGQNVANEKLAQFLSEGTCAVVEFRQLPMK